MKGTMIEEQKKVTGQIKGTMNEAKMKEQKKVTDQMKE